MYMAINPNVLISEYLYKHGDSLTKENKERIAALYKGKTFHDLYNLVNAIAIVDCGNNHERSARDPSTKQYSYFECPLRPKNARCGHCLDSPLGKSKYGEESYHPGLSSRMILEDTILLLNADGNNVNAPDELFDRINDASEKLMHIDVGAVDSYGRLFGTRPEHDDSCIGEWNDFGEDDLCNIKTRVNAASHPHGEPILELKEIVKASLEKALPDLLDAKNK